MATRMIKVAVDAVLLESMLAGPKVMQERAVKERKDGALCTAEYFDYHAKCLDDLRVKSQLAMFGNKKG